MKFREWQKAKASPEEEVKLKEYVEARKAVAKAKQKERKYLKNKTGKVLVEADGVKERWREYMERLLNIEGYLIYE